MLSDDPWNPKKNSNRLQTSTAVVASTGNMDLNCKVRAFPLLTSPELGCWPHVSLSTTMPQYLDWCRTLPKFKITWGYDSVRCWIYNSCVWDTPKPSVNMFLSLNGTCSPGKLDLHGQHHLNTLLLAKSWLRNLMHLERWYQTLGKSTSISSRFNFPMAWPSPNLPCRGHLMWNKYSNGLSNRWFWNVQVSSMTHIHTHTHGYIYIYIIL